ncbi:sensor histidine kinase [uncultured Sphingomonas sp.]|uniref:sensor histidine kinase n=1 Tax=uncultured Sphingomonas sp. TaxID=158754 RepID=UPI0035CB882A
MNAADDTVSAPVRGLVDQDGRLVEADPRLADLNIRNGGTVGTTFAVPQIAVLARLAQRLGIVVSRTVRVAEGQDEVELWIRALPEREGVRLEVSGWSQCPPWRSRADPVTVERDFIRHEADWTWESDTTLRLTMVGPQAAAHGIEPGKALGKPLTDLVTLNRDAAGGLPLLSALAFHRRVRDQQAIVRATGARVILFATPLLDPAGGFAGFAGGCRLVSLVMTPDVIDTVRDGFSSRLDRALRAPLARIVANADSIAAQVDGPVRQDYADYAADIATAGRHLMALVDDLVDLRAIERPDFAPALEQIDLADVGRRAAGLLSVRAGDRGIHIDRPGDADRLPATGEFRRVLQILINLIGNAVRFSPDGGMVWVLTQRAGDRAVVIVADQGPGIAEADQMRIFEKFERIDPAEPGGSGLGLYIARRLARAMGGDVTVDSAPGQGARFLLSLPVRGT